MRLWPSCPLTIYSNSCWVLRTESFWILTYLPIHSEISQGLGPNLNNYKLIYNIVTCSHTAWSWFYTSSQVSLCTKQNPILPSAQKKKMCFCTPAERNIWANPIPGGGGSGGRTRVYRCWIGDSRRPWRLRLIPSKFFFSLSALKKLFRF
jgi:hypothetical protein